MSGISIPAGDGEIDNLFYVTEGPFMHLTVCCRFLICCVLQVFCPGGGGGGGGNRVVSYFTTLFSGS